MDREPGVVLFPGKALFLGGGNNVPVLNNAGGAIVIIAGDA